MSRRATLTAADAARLVSLALEACELHAARIERIKFVLAGLNRLVGTRFAVASHYRGIAQDAPLQLEPIVADGELLASEAAAIGFYLAQGDHESDPSLPVFRRQLNSRYLRGEKNHIANKPMLIEPRPWYTHDHVLDVRKNSNIDEFAYSGYEGTTPNLIHGLSVHRAWGERALDTRELAIIQAAHMGMRRLLEGPDPAAPIAQTPPTAPPATPGPPPVLGRLTPQQRRLTELLVAGKSVKQAAALMGISTLSAGTYLRAIHRRLGVTSRAELVALVLKR